MAPEVSVALPVTTDVDGDPRASEVRGEEAVVDAAWVLDGRGGIPESVESPDYFFSFCGVSTIASTTRFFPAEDE